MIFLKKYLHISEKSSTFAAGFVFNVKNTSNRYVFNAESTKHKIMLNT